MTYHEAGSLPELFFPSHIKKFILHQDNNSCLYSRTSAAQTLSHGYFELVPQSLTKRNPTPADIIVSWIILGDFLFCIDKVCCVFSLESPCGGDSNENTQHTSC